MRTLSSLVFLSLLATPALADGIFPTIPVVPQAPVISLAPIDMDTMPERCKPIAKRATGPSLPQALSGRISLASCLADTKLANLQLIDGGESIVAVDAGVAPAFALLDNVIEVGDPGVQVIAHHAKAELYDAMAMRMLATIPVVAGTPEAIALNISRRQLLEAMLTPWRDQTRDAYVAIDTIAKAHPELSKNPVVIGVVRDSRQRLAQTAVATREP